MFGSNDPADCPLPSGRAPSGMPQAGLPFFESTSGPGKQRYPVKAPWSSTGWLRCSLYRGEAAAIAVNLSLERPGNDR
jgi:hypothetical protein